MRRTSEEIEYKSHNLWLIDERFADFHLLLFHPVKSDRHCGKVLHLTKKLTTVITLFK